MVYRRVCIGEQNLWSYRVIWEERGIDTYTEVTRDAGQLVRFAEFGVKLHA